MSNDTESTDYIQSSENSNKLNNLLWEIVAIVIGGAIVYYLFWRPRQQIVSGQQQHLSDLRYRMEQLDMQSEELKRLQQQVTNSTEQQILTANNHKNEYKNDERWEILRGKDGFISNLRVIRDAKIHATNY